MDLEIRGVDVVMMTRMMMMMISSGVDDVCFETTYENQESRESLQNHLLIGQLSFHSCYVNVLLCHGYVILVHF